MSAPTWLLAALCSLGACGGSAFYDEAGAVDAGNTADAGPDLDTASPTETTTPPERDSSPGLTDSSTPAMEGGAPSDARSGEGGSRPVDAGGCRPGFECVSPGPFCPPGFSPCARAGESCNPGFICCEACP
jgi:hypothetical protein